MPLPGPFTISFRAGFVVGLAVALSAGLKLFFLWQPDEQVRLHTHHLFQKIERHDWSAVGNLLADDYRDQWNDDRARVLQRMQLVLSALRDLHIEAQDELTLAADRSGHFRARIRISAERGELSEMILPRVNSLQRPFELEWRQQSAKPWDWKLVSVKNSELEIPEGYD